MRHIHCQPFLAALHALGLLAAGAPAQFTWTARTPAANPPARHRHALAFDPGRGVAVVFGGNGTSSLLADTWEWNGATWSAPGPAASPPGRAEHALVHDTVRGGILLFGGFTGTSVGFLQDTWRYDGLTWSAVQTATSPPPRKGHALAADPRGGGVVLFGGGDNIGPLGDTWAFDGSDWRQLQPAASPSPRSGHAMVLDPLLGRIVLFGGFGAQPRGDTWTFDGSAWTAVPTAQAPSPRAYHAMAFDSARGRTVLFGGDAVIPLQTWNDTWEFDGDWRPRQPAASPPARRDHALACDPLRGEVVCFGGAGGAPGNPILQDTWTGATTAPATVTGFGAGCPGSAGVPAFVHPPAELPWTGGMLRQLVAALPAGQPAFALLGFSRTAWGALALPLPLDSYGMPGCALFTSVDASVPLPRTGTTAELVLPVPALPVLAGLRLHAQTAVLDPGTNAAGLIGSDAVAITVGAR